jgi:adenylate cyclase
VYGFIVGVVLYEFGVRILLGHFIKIGQRLPALVRYGTAFVDASIPTVILIIYAQFVPVSTTLLSPWSFLYFLFIALSALRLDFKLCYFTGAVAAIEYALLGILLTRGSNEALDEPMLVEPLAHVSKGFLLLSAGLAAGFVTREIRKRVYGSFRAIQERNRVVGIFGQHVSPTVVDKLLDQEADVEGQVQHVCIMFLDIRGFTRYAEHRSPKEVISYLNTLFGAIIEIVNRNHGMISKFLGDGFMAVFGAPIAEGNESENAVNTSFEILDTVKAAIARGEIPETRLSIGLHAGDVVIGNVGSTLRKEYTIVGDVVNTASRIEQLNKKYDSQLLVSNVVWMATEENQRRATDLGESLVEGREKPVQVFRLY